MLSLLSLLMIGAVISLISSIFICFYDAKLGLQVAFISVVVLFVDLFLLSLF